MTVGIEGLGSEDHSSSHVSWLVELQLQPGALRAFLDLTEEMAVATSSEPGALIYERSISADKTRIIVFERYADADAAIRHLNSFGSLFGARFSAPVTRRSFTVFGAVTDEVQELLAPLGATFARRLAGFVR
jgi:quinol monooxygenase YgiN